MTPLPLNVVLKNPRTNVQMTIPQGMSEEKISTVVPGGFGTFTFVLGEAAARRLDFPLEVFYGSDVIVTDFGGATLFEGILTDVKYHSDAGDARYECEVAGSQMLFDAPYRNMVVERNIPWTAGNLAYDPTFTRQSVIPATIGQVSATDATLVGVRFDVPTGVAVTAGWRGTAQFLMPPSSFIAQFYADASYDTNRTATFNLNIYQLDNTGTRSFLGTIFAPGTATTTISVNTFSSARGVFLELACAVGGTTAANVFSQLSNIRILGTRIGVTGSSNVEPVYGHEIVSDIINRSGISTDYSGLELDFSYQVPEFSYLSSDSSRNALDSITAYYNRYWAVWENKKVFWKSWSSTQLADWIVSKSSGAQVDIDPSITNTANVALIQYQDAAGIAQETSISDTRADNVYTLAGRTRTSLVPLGIVTTSTAATQLGAAYFPDHSYEVVGGTITMPAEAKCFSQTYGTMLPAYKIRAGETVRLRDGNTTRSLFDDRTWNRSTLFRITATDLDWEAQTISLTLDNSQASLDQIMARVQTSLTAKYGL